MAKTILNPHSLSAKWNAIFAIALASTLISCTNQSKSSSGNVKITMPTTAQLQSLSSKTSAKASSLATSSKINWGVSDPTVIADINCFLVMYQGTEAINSRNSCTSSTGAPVSSPGAWFGGFAPGETTSIEVPAGASRILSIVGFKASSNLVCKQVKSGLDATRFSSPFLLGSSSQNLSAGDNNVSIDISLGSATRLDTCSGPDFDPIKVAPSNPTTTYVKWVTMPSGGGANSLWSTPGTLAIVDVNGNIVDHGPDASATITISLSQGTGTLTGTNAGPFLVTVVNGVANLSSLGLKIDSSGTGKILAAVKQSTVTTGGSPSATGLSSAFAITSGVPSALTITPPMSIAAGSSLPYLFTVVDSSGNTVTSYLGTLTISSSDSNAVLPGPYTFVAADAGQKNLTLQFKTSGSQTLTAAGSGLAVNTTSISVASGPAVALNFVSPPSNLQQTSQLPTISIRATDTYGNPLSSSSIPITLSIGFDANSAGTTLINSGTINTINGIATFPNLSLNQFGNGYSLKASSAGLPSITSPTFNSIRSLAFVPTTSTITTNSATLLPIVGGVGPFVYAVTSGSGSINQSGVYTSTGTTGDSVIRVTDQTTGINVSTTVSTSLPGLYQSVAAGTQSTCAITMAGKLRCWGNNYYGQLGVGTATNTPQNPTNVDTTTTYASIAAGTYHMCGITTSGTLKCWGLNVYGQVGIGATSSAVSSPTIVDAGTTYSQVSLGDFSTCGITTSNIVKCWGSNTSGQVGIGSTTQNITSPAVVGSSYSNVSAGGGHACAITLSGLLFCWGDNSSGQLGIGANSNSLSPMQVPGITGTTSLATGSAHTCVVSNSNYLSCWGVNTQNQLGDGTAIAKSGPTPISTNYTSVVSHADSSCGTTTAGSVKCWGANVAQQLGSSNISFATPTSMDSQIAKISLGYYHSCAITSASTLSCWGSNGDGATGNKLPPFTLSSMTADPSETYSSVSVGGTFNLGLTAGGILKGWGLVANASTASEPASVGVSGEIYTSSSAGINFMCFVNSAHLLRCQGVNDTSQLGDGTTTASAAPISIDPGTQYSSVTTGIGHACGLTVAGVVKCWGNNSAGQVGNGTTNLVSTPTIIDAGTTYLTIVSTYMHTCGITMSHVTKCWGYNSSGQVGNGNTTPQLTPQVVPSMNAFVSLAVGAVHSCGLDNSGKIYCWGQGTAGQLGSGIFADSLFPTQVNETGAFTSFSAGEATTCGIKSNGDLKCWGSLQTLQQNVASPAVIDAGTSYSSVSSRAFRICGITTSGGKVKCSGNGQSKALGIGIDLPLIVAPFTSYVL